MHALERRQEDREVVRLARLEPGDVRLAALARPGGRELGGHAPRLLPVAARDADQARVVGVVAELRPRAAPPRRAAGRSRRRRSARGRAPRASPRPRTGRLRPSAASSSAGPSRARRARARDRGSPPAAASDPQALCSPGANLPVGLAAVERRRLGADGPEISVLGIGTAPIGSGSGLDRLGRPGRGRGDRGDPRRARRRRELDRHGAVLRLGPRRGDRPAARSPAGATTSSCSRSAARCPPRTRSRGWTTAPEAIRADLEASLRRLGVDHVDLLQIHDVDPETPIEDSWGEIQRLIEEGKVRWGGLSNHTVELVARRTRSRP